MAEEKAFTPDAYATIGARYGSTGVAHESELAEGRWERDVDALARYGHGRSALAKYKDLRARHQQAMAQRPNAVNAKRHSVLERDARISAAWEWMDAARSNVTPLARGDAKIAVVLKSALAENDVDLPAKIEAMRSLLGDVQSRLPEDANIPQLLADAATVASGLEGTHGQVHSKRGAAMEDTFELDRLDGELYVRILDLNAAARRAIRNGKLEAQLSDYRLHFLKRSGRPGAVSPEGEPAAPSAS